MPVQLEMQQNNRVFVATWSNPMTHDDYLQVFEFIYPYYENAQLPIHSLFNALDVTNAPARSMTTLLKDPRSPLVHRNAGLTVVVTSNEFIRTLVDAVVGLGNHSQLIGAKSVKEAQLQIKAKLIAEARQQPDWQIANL